MSLIRKSEGHVVNLYIVAHLVPRPLEVKLPERKCTLFAICCK